jgi:hypothetical protein
MISSDENAQTIRQHLKDGCPSICEYSKEYEHELESFCTECKRPGTDYMHAFANTANAFNPDFIDEKSMNALVRVIEQTSPELSNIFKTGYATLCKNLCSNPNPVQKICTNCESIIDNFSDSDLVTLARFYKKRNQSY